MELIKEALSEQNDIEFDVNSPQLSFAGHTVYRLIIKIYNDDGQVHKQECLSWKRFKEFQKLHKDLKTNFPIIFKELFPEFAKKKIFGRFDESVIEERRLVSMKLLSLISSHADMLLHEAFQTFIQLVRANKLSNDKLLPNQTNNSQPINVGTEDSQAVTRDVTAEETNTQSSETACDDDHQSDDDVFLAIESNIDSEENQSFFLEARSLCGEDLESLASEAADSFPFTSPRESFTDDLNNIPNNDDDESLNNSSSDNNNSIGDDIYTETEPKNEDNSEGISLDNLSPLEDSLSSNNNNDLHSTNQIDYNSTNQIDCNSTNQTDYNSTNQTDCNSTNQTDHNSTNQTDSNANDIGITIDHKFTVDEKMSKIIEQTIEEDDYIFQASLAMSNAMEQEEIENHEAAFDLYKFGIGLLLRGVQTDNNKDRRDAVRRKTAQYLLKAEKLYNGQLTTCGEKMILGDNKWRFKLSDVKVFGVIDKVMLVQKVYTEDIFVMKVLHKQGGEYKPRKIAKKKTKSPRNLYNCHSVARLYNCVETSTGVYLLLEYITGGRLWDYLHLPIFDTCIQRTPTNESCHSWNPNERSMSHIENSLTAECSIIDIPTTPRSALEQNETITPLSFKCKLKKSASMSTICLENKHLTKWSAQIAYALMELHCKGVICRDLNPRNILIDGRGNIKLTYFSNIEGIDYPLDQDAVEMLYTSPEAGGVFEATKACDWWSFGALLFELLMGEPLFTCHPNGITQRSVITLPRRVSNEACSLLAGLLKYNPKERLGAGPNGNEEIKSHPFFNQINWKKIRSM